MVKKVKRKVQKGKRIPIECLEAASKSLNLFSEDELKSYMVDVFERSKDYKNLSGNMAIKQAMKDVSDNQLKVLLDSAATKARNVVKFERNAEMINKDGLPLRSLLIRTTQNKDYNVESAQRAAKNNLQTEVFKSLTDEENKIFQLGNIDEEIAAAASGKKVSDPIAQKIGDILKRYPEEIRNPRMIASDALSIAELNGDRMLRQVHDPIRLLRAGQSNKDRLLKRNKVDSDTPLITWREDIKKQLNIEKTAKNLDCVNLDGSIDNAKLDKELAKIYDNIITSKSDLFTKSVVANDREAKKRLRRMTFVFKDWEALNAYNKQYGKGTLFESLQADIQSSSNRIGIAEIFGDSPESMYNDLKDTAFEKFGRQYKKEVEAENLMKTVMGSTAGISSPNLANFGKVLRGLSSVAKLGKLMLNSLPDISQVASMSQRMGFGYWKPFVRAIAGQLQLLPQAERRMLAKQMHLNVNAQMGFIGSYAEATSPTDVMSKFSNTFYFATFMKGWDKSLKQSGLVDLAKNLGKVSSKSLKDLNSQTRFYLEKFNLSDHEWDALRKKTKDGLFSLDNVADLTDKELNALWQLSDKKVSLSEYRSHINRKVYSLFDAVSENTVLDPGAYERMVTTGNLPAGTALGEITRSFMQFKSYPIANFRRVWYGGMSDMQGGQAKLMYAVNSMIGMFMLSYLSKVLVNFASGKTTQNFSNFTLKEWTELLAPGLGTFSRIIDPKAQNTSLITNFLLTPSVRLFTSPFVSATSLATGNLEGAKKNAKEFISYANPIGTLPGVEPYINALMGKKPHLEPGQKQLFGA